MSTIEIILIIVGVILFAGYIILVSAAASALVIPPVDCPDCKSRMFIKNSNVYTGEVVYECPNCNKRIFRHYKEDEIFSDDDLFKCPLSRDNSKTDKVVKKDE